MRKIERNIWKQMMDGLHPTQLRGRWGPAHILGHKNGQRITSSAFQMRSQNHKMGHQVYTW